MKNAKVPGKLSELIRLAIADARSLDREKYAPNADVWHRPLPDGRCQVCVSGAAMAVSLGTKPDQLVRNVDNLPPGWDRAALALNYAREGLWVTAVNTLQNRLVSGETRTALMAMTQTQHGWFRSWNRFTKHLEELSEAADTLELYGV